ncbi:hypothetical protein Tco_0779890 [Tanacetum coccineum]
MNTAGGIKLNKRHELGIHVTRSILNESLRMSSSRTLTGDTPTSFDPLTKSRTLQLVETKDYKTQANRSSIHGTGAPQVRTWSYELLSRKFFSSSASSLPFSDGAKLYGALAKVQSHSWSDNNSRANAVDTKLLSAPLFDLDAFTLQVSIRQATDISFNLVGTLPETFWHTQGSAEIVDYRPTTSDALNLKITPSSASNLPDLAPRAVCTINFFFMFPWHGLSCLRSSGFNMGSSTIVRASTCKSATSQI